MKEGTLRIVPLGGAGEIGKNMVVFEYENDIVVVDSGLMFPESDMLGIDIVFPDIQYLVERKEMVRAIILTHGHEDHIGALPHVLSQVNVPVYATRLTRGLAEVKMREHAGIEATFHTVHPKDTVSLGAFQVEFFRVCHSIPDAVGVAITTPVGTVVHASDYKFDPNPVDGQLTDFSRLAELGQRGVLALLSDSTNAEVEGLTPSETEVGAAINQVFEKAKGRILVATFASNISRIQQVADIAEQHGRRFGVIGRSMEANVQMAVELDYLNVDLDSLLTPSQMENLPAHEVAIMCTGTQGEPTSVLVRMSIGEHRRLRVHKGDTVVFSASPIPGNEEMINRTIDNLFRQGADVLYEERMNVHVSGHGSREDHKLMINLTRPRYLIPIHGEYRHLVLHSHLAQNMGIPPENTFIIENGQVIEFDADGARLGEQVTKGNVLVDGLGIGDVGPVVLRDRQHLSQNGFLVAIVGIDHETGEVVIQPEVLSRGFVHLRESELLLQQAREVILSQLVHGGPPTTVSNKIKGALGEFFYRETRRRPVILPLVVEV